MFRTYSAKEKRNVSEERIDNVGGGNGHGRDTRNCADRSPPRQDVAVQAFGSFVTTTQNGIDNKATNSGGLLATTVFSSYHGVEADYGYSLNTQKYVSTSGVTGVNTNSHEISGAYVFRMPLRKITPFALAGAGALAFNPKNDLGASIQTRASFIYGAGTDINFDGPHLPARRVPRLCLQVPHIRFGGSLRHGPRHASCGTFDWFRL